MLRDQGIQRVELLLGYLPHVIQEHFGDGGRFGVEIGYSVSVADDQTDARLRERAAALAVEKMRRLHHFR